MPIIGVPRRHEPPNKGRFTPHFPRSVAAPAIYDAPRPGRSPLVARFGIEVAPAVDPTPGNAKDANMKRARAIERLLQCLAMAVVCASQPASATVPRDLDARLRLFVEQQPLPFDGEVELTVGEPDPRLQLATCRRYEPFIPSGARLWGRTSLGVRCVDGAQWSVFLPVQVRVYGPALVAARPIARGQSLASEDFRVDRVEWTAWAPGVVTVAPDQAEGRLATRAIQPGEALRRDMLRTPPAFLAGDPIKVVYTGPGFSVGTEGKALTLGNDGQAAQAAVNGGRIVTGVARPGRILEVR